MPKKRAPTETVVETPALPVTEIPQSLQSKKDLIVMGEAIQAIKLYCYDIDKRLEQLSDWVKWMNIGFIISWCLICFLGLYLYFR